MDSSTPPKNKNPYPGLATQHCLTLSIKVTEKAYDALYKILDGTGDIGRIVEAITAEAKSTGAPALSTARYRYFQTPLIRT